MCNLDDKFKSINHKIIGETYTNTKGLKFTVLEAFRHKSDYRFKVRFIESGYTVITKKTQINKGLIKDKLTPSFYGVGMMGYGTTKGKVNLKEYSIWNAMLTRCYNENDDNYIRYGSLGVSVCKRWHRFDYFLEDLKSIDNYDEFLFYNNELYLDKDFKQLHLPMGERVYSLDTCTFLSKKENDSLRILKGNNDVKVRAVNKDEDLIFDSLSDFSEYSNIPLSTCSWMLKNSKISRDWKIIRI